MDNDFAEVLPVLITTTILLCCCCVVLIGGGAGAFFFFRNRNKTRPASAPAAAPAGPAPASFVPAMGAPAARPVVVEATAAIVDAPAAPEPPAGPTGGAETPSPLPPAAPVEPDDIRAKLLGLNGPDKPYVVQATGYKIAIAPGEVTGYLLEISFDYAEKVARFVETGPAGQPALKEDARAVLEAEGWTVRG